MRRTVETTTLVVLPGAAAYWAAVREAYRAGKRKGTVLGTKELYKAIVGKQALRFFPK